MSNVISLDQVRKNKGELKKKDVIDPFKVAKNDDVKDRGTEEDYIDDMRAAAYEKSLEDRADEEATFKALEKKNRENAERVRKERLNANKSVLRSYRIRND